MLERFVLPALRAALVRTEPTGEMHLRWELIDPKRQAEHRVELRRRSTSLGEQLKFLVRQGSVILRLDVDNPLHRPRIPLAPEFEVPPESLARVGWHGAPKITWSYLRMDNASGMGVRVEWTLPQLPRSWALRQLSKIRSVECTLDQESFSLFRASEEELRFAGVCEAPSLSRRPPKLHIRLDPPLVLVQEGDDAKTWRIDREVEASFSPTLLWALVNDFETRLVTDDDLGNPFAARMLLDEEVLPPSSLPSGQILGLPWDVEVQEVERGSSRAWGLSPSPDSLATASMAGTWGEALGQQRCWPVSGNPEEASTDSGVLPLGPAVFRTSSRRASVVWHIESLDATDPLVSCVPYWTHSALESGKAPMGGEVNGVIEIENGDGFREKLRLDPQSLQPEERLVLDTHHSVSQERGNGGAPPLILGQAGGHIRWERHVPGDPLGASDLSAAQPFPTDLDWSMGENPMLLVSERGTRVRRWGGLYYPPALRTEEVPWRALRPVPPILGAEPDQLQFQLGPQTTVAWLDLGGFVCRYDRVEITLAYPGREASETTAWIADPGLSLPRSLNEALLNVLCPVSVQWLPRSFDFAFEEGHGAQKPVLTLGQGLATEAGFSRLRLDQHVRLWSQTSPRGTTPRHFGTFARPEQITPLAIPDPDQALWVAVAPLASALSRLILSWDPGAGWRFRGFFSDRGDRVNLGKFETADKHLMSVALGQASEQVDFSFDENARWESLPVALKSLLDAEAFKEWQETVFSKAYKPTALDDFDVETEGPSVRLVERNHSTVATQPLPFAVWEPEAGESPEVFTRAKKHRETPVISSALSDPPAAPSEASPDPESTGDPNKKKRRIRRRTRPLF